MACRVGLNFPNAVAPFRIPDPYQMWITIPTFCKGGPTSGFGTFRTWRDVGLESVFKGKAEIGY